MPLGLYLLLAFLVLSPRAFGETLLPLTATMTSPRRSCPISRGLVQALWKIGSGVDHGHVDNVPVVCFMSAEQLW